MNNNFSHHEKRKGLEFTIKKDGIDFKGTKLISSAIERISLFLRGFEKDILPPYNIDKDRTVYQRNGNFFLIEYTKKEIRDEDKKLFQEKFRSGRYFPERENDGSQVPEVDFETEYAGKYYLLVEALLNLNNENHSGKGIYKGVVFNPKRYFSITKQIRSSKKEAENIIEKNTNKKTK